MIIGAIDGPARSSTETTLSRGIARRPRVWSPTMLSRPTYPLRSSTRSPLFTTTHVVGASRLGSGPSGTGFHAPHAPHSIGTPTSIHRDHCRMKRPRVGVRRI
jgi:hypothetical protein